MGNRTVTTSLSIQAQQDTLQLGTTQNLQTTQTTPADAVPLGTVVSLAIGNNTIAIPGKAAGVFILPTQGTSNTLILKGASGDTGVVIQSVTTPAPFPPASFAFAQAAMTQFVLNSAIAIAVQIIWQ